MLTRDELAKELSYNPDTGEFFWLRAASRRKMGQPAGNVKENGYRVISFRYKMYGAHRLAFLMMEGALPSDCVDHINGNRSDNRWENLRHATRVMNSRNLGRSAANTSGITGVHWHKRTGTWQSHIMIDGKSKFLGYFKTIFDAAAARLSANNAHGFHENHGTARCN